MKNIRFSFITMLLTILLCMSYGIVNAQDQNPQSDEITTPNQNDKISGQEINGSVFSGEDRGFQDFLQIYEERGMTQDAQRLRELITKKAASKDSVAPSSLTWWIIDDYVQGLPEQTTGAVYVVRNLLPPSIEHSATVRAQLYPYDEMKIKHLQMLGRAWNTSNTQIYSVEFGFDNASDVWCRRTDAPFTGWAKSDATFTFDSGKTMFYAEGSY